MEKYPPRQLVSRLPYFVIGCERFGMTRQLFDTEQLCPQWRLARAWLHRELSKQQ